MAIYDFIMDPNIGPYSRIIRDQHKEKVEVGLVKKKTYLNQTRLKMHEWNLSIVEFSIYYTEQAVSSQYLTASVYWSWFRLVKFRGPGLLVFNYFQFFAPHTHCALAELEDTVANNPVMAVTAAVLSCI